MRKGSDDVGECCCGSEIVPFSEAEGVSKFVSASTVPSATIASCPKNVVKSKTHATAFRRNRSMVNVLLYHMKRDCRKRLCYVPQCFKLLPFRFDYRRCQSKNHVRTTVFRRSSLTARTANTVQCTSVLLHVNRYLQFLQTPLCRFRLHIALPASQIEENDVRH